MMMRSFFLFAALLSCTLFLAFPQFSHGAGLLEVNKTVEAAPRTGHYTVTIAYRAVGGPGRVFNVRIVDSLPEELTLASGDLVAKVEDPATEEWYSHAYTVKPRNLDLTIATPSAVVELPSAEVSYTTANSNAPNTVYTEPVTLLVELPIPKGSMDLWPVIGFFTLVFPVVAGVYSLSQYSNQIKKKK